MIFQRKIFNFDAGRNVRRSTILLVCVMLSLTQYSTDILCSNLKFHQFISPVAAQVISLFLFTILIKTDRVLAPSADLPAAS